MLLKLPVLVQKDFWKRLIHLLTEKDVFFNASAITFNLFIFFIPFCLLMVSFIGFILSYDTAVAEISRYTNEFFPGLIQENIESTALLIERIVNPIVQRRGFFGLIGIGILILTSLALFACLKHVVFVVFDIEERAHPFMDIVYNFVVFGLIGGVFILFSIILSIISVITFNEINVPYTNMAFEVAWAFELFTSFVPLFITFLMFFVIYRYLSERRVSFEVAAIGAICYTVLFEMAKFGVSYYFDYAFRTYQSLYQSYTFLIILSVWVFYSSVLFVVSTIFARAYQDTEPEFELIEQEA